MPLRLLIVLLCLGTFSNAGAAEPHPLDGLRADEYRAVRDILTESGDADEQSLYAMIRLEEPPKSAVLAWSRGAGNRVPRIARVSVRRAERLFDARVDLDARAVISIEEVNDAQSSILLSEFAQAQSIVVEDRGWQADMRKRGYDPIDPDRFMCLPFAAGYFAEAELENRRVLRVQCFDLLGTHKHLFPRPIEGLTAVVDPHAKSVLRVVDEDVVTVPAPSGNYDEASLQPYRDTMNPIEVDRPDGASYTFDGSFVDWGPWRFHLRWIGGVD